MCSCEWARERKPNSPLLTNSALKTVTSARVNGSLFIFFAMFAIPQLLLLTGTRINHALYGGEYIIIIIIIVIVKD